MDKLKKWILFLPLMFYEVLFEIIPEMVDDVWEGHNKRKEKKS